MTDTTRDDYTLHEIPKHLVEFVEGFLRSTPDRMKPVEMAMVVASFLQVYGLGQEERLAVLGMVAGMRPADEVDEALMSFPAHTITPTTH